METIEGQIIENEISALENKVEDANSTINTVIEDAAERVEAAQETAAAIVEAAMTTSLGKELDETKKDIWEWQGNAKEMELKISSLAEQVSELKTAITAMIVSTPQTEQSSLIQPISETVETMPEVLEVLPETLQSAVEENPVPPVPEIPKRQRRWI